MPGEPARSRPRRRYRSHAGRDTRVTTRVDAQAWRRVDARAEKAGWALGTWMVLLAADVAAGRPVASEELLEQVAGARVRVDRLGTAINAMASTENVGEAVPEAQLRAVLDSLAARVNAATEAAQAAGEVFAGAGAATQEPVAAGEAFGRRARKEPTAKGEIRARMTAGERAQLAAAAARDGLSVGAWLGLLMEDPAVVRPLRGEVWGSVFGLRKALRRVATNLAQIAAARRARGEQVPPFVTDAQAQVDDAIRACLAAQGTISAAPAGVAS